MRNPFRYFNSSPEIIRLTVMMYIRYPLSLRQAEDLLYERGIDIVRHQIKWNNRRRELKELLAHLVCHFMRRFCDVASADVRMFFV